MFAPTGTTVDTEHLNSVMTCIPHTYTLLLSPARALPWTPWGSQQDYVYPAKTWKPGPRGL